MREVYGPVHAVFKTNTMCNVVDNDENLDYE